MRFLRFRKWKIVTKLPILSLGSVVIISGIVLAYIVPEAREAVSEERRKGLENAVGLVFKLLQEYESRAMAGEFPLEEAKAKAAKRISVMRYGRDGYFWIMDTNHVMIMHPAQPELKGRVLADSTDAQGTPIFREFAAICARQGSGHIDYFWPKPGMKEPVRKHSYVRLFENWGWIVGIGIYTDDVNRETRVLYNRLFLIVLFTGVFVSIAGLLLAHQLINPIQELARDAAEVAKGNYTVKLECEGDDEIGVLTSSFKSMVSSIETAMMEIRRKNEALDQARTIAEEQARVLEIQAEELKAANKVAVDALRLKSEFLRNVTHEFRTPMNGLIGMNDLLLETKLDEEQRDYAATIKQCANDLMHIVNQVLNFSKIESRLQEYHEEVIDFENLVKRALLPQAQLIARKKLVVSHRVDDQLGDALEGNSEFLLEVLSALTSNAAKFTGNAGTIRIDVDLLQSSGSTVETKFSVHDTGIGIPVGSLDSVFQPFVQGDGASNRKYGGMGMGLAMSKAIVEMIGGRIGVNSVEGTGSTFWFSVPLKKHNAG
jgi:signal transduction histidine kinase